MFTRAVNTPSMPTSPVIGVEISSVGTLFSYSPYSFFSVILDGKISLIAVFFLRAC